MRSTILMPAIRRGACFAVALALFVPALFPTPALAQHHDRNDRGRGPVIVSRLPPGNRPLHFRGNPFFYHQGLFYRHHTRGYVVVRPPIGLRLDFLPEGCTRVYFGGLPYYFYDDVYYDYLPTEKVYVVVDKPAGTAEALTTDKLSLADGSAMVGTYVGGTKSVVQFEVNGEIKEITRDKIISLQFAPPKQ